jgi:hypothetical protein
LIDNKFKNAKVQQKDRLWKPLSVFVGPDLFIHPSIGDRPQPMLPVISTGARPLAFFTVFVLRTKAFALFPFIPSASGEALHSSFRPERSGAEKSPAKRTLSLAVFLAPSAEAFASFSVFVLRTKAFALFPFIFSASGEALHSSFRPERAD